MQRQGSWTLCALILSIASCSVDDAALPAAGQWRVVNYWAIWCTPCREEIPELNALDRETPLVVLAINYDGVTGEQLRTQAATLGIAFGQLETDPGPALGVPRPRVLPTTLLVDPQGHVTDTLVGPQTREGLLSLWESRR